MINLFYDPRMSWTHRYRSRFGVVVGSWTRKIILDIADNSRCLKRLYDIGKFQMGLRVIAPSRTILARPSFQNNDNPPKLPELVSCLTSEASVLFLASFHHIFYHWEWINVHFQNDAFILDFILKTFVRILKALYRELNEDKFYQDQFLNDWLIQ